MSIAAIYGRKSLITGKGESIKNQIDACREYAQGRNWEIIEYYDEGFSGKDTDRPGFQQLLRDIENKRVNHVIFYKLDRISRRMLDILDFIELTNGKGIDFISITENFDTTTPLGRAMVHIAATFAQLEREMLQQRVKDNMLRLAKTGRWLGGITPTGYSAKQIHFIDDNGKTKYKYILEEIDDEIHMVNVIYKKYLEYKSLSKVKDYLNQNNLKTKKGNDYHKQTIKAILTNPVYVKADVYAYEYFRSLNMDIATEKDTFDGLHGVITYNKNIIKKGHKNEFRSHRDWIIAVSSHRGILNGKDWVRVQGLLQKNRSRHPRKSNGSIGLLTGLLQCECGKLMKIKYGNRDKDTNKPIYYYVCGEKRNKDNKGCNTPNFRGDLLDNIVLERLKALSYDNKKVQDCLAQTEAQSIQILLNQQHKREGLKELIEEKNKHIQNLLNQLQTNTTYAISNRIKERIEKLDKEIEDIKDEIETLKSRSENIFDGKVDLGIIKEKLQLISIVDRIEDRVILRNLIEELADRIILTKDQLLIDLHGYIKRGRG